MAQIPYRANTQTSLFPLLSQLGSQTIINPNNLDNTFIRGMNPSETAAPPEYGVPQIFYAHNVMPSTYGFQSVGFIQQYPNAGGNLNLDNAYLVMDVNRARTYVAPDYTNGRRLYFLNSAGLWTTPSASPSSLDPSNRVSTGTINGVTYICVARRGVYKYSQWDNVLTKVTLKGLNDSNVLGIVSASGYLIAWSRTGVSWSSVNDPLDFEPSDISGAGAGEIQDAAGDIVTCQATAIGFIVYTTNNAISVTYSGNSVYPFNFKAITGAGGVASSDLISREVVGSQYAYTTNGLQQVWHTGAKTSLPFVTDFVAGQIFEDFDEATNTFLISQLSGTMEKKLTLVSDRYLVISYGKDQNQPMTHAIVIDVVQTRMGKLKIPHSACFELRNIAPEVIETPRRSLAFLHPNGTVKVVDFNTESAGSNGVMLLGKYQLQRANETGLEKVQIENAPSAARLSVVNMMSYDGKNFQNKVDGHLFPEESSGYLKTYLFNTESKSHSILLKGQFNLTGLVLWFTLEGTRT